LCNWMRDVLSQGDAHAHLIKNFRAALSETIPEFLRHGHPRLVERLGTFLLRSNTEVRTLRLAVADAEIQLGNARRAIGELEKLIDDHPDYFHASMRLGQLYARAGKVDEAAAAYDSGFDAWYRDADSSDFRRRQASAISRGVPGIPIVAMPRSGSEFLLETMASALGIPILYPNVGTLPKDRLLKSTLRHLANGGCIARLHSDGSKENLDALERAGVRRIVVHVRDPRQSAVSWCRVVAALSDTDFEDARLLLDPSIPLAFRSWSPSDQLAWTSERYLPGLVYFLETWLSPEVERRFQLCVTQYEKMRGREGQFLKMLASHFGQDIPDVDKLLLEWPVESRRNFRRGRLNEWQDVMPLKMQREVTARLDPAWLARFCWPGV
jgi:tetratricopeptide (TPR) repeat protein